jgi:hypothetical protein
MFEHGQSMRAESGKNMNHRAHGEKAWGLGTGRFPRSVIRCVDVRTANAESGKSLCFLLSKDIILLRWSRSCFVDRSHFFICACGGRANRYWGVERFAGRAVAILGHGRAPAGKMPTSKSGRGSPPGLERVPARSRCGVRTRGKCTKQSPPGSECRGRSADCGGEDTGVIARRAGERHWGRCNAERRNEGGAEFWVPSRTVSGDTKTDPSGPVLTPTPNMH